MRAGNVFVDVEGTTDRGMEFSAASGAQTVSMGGVMNVPDGDTVHFTLLMLNLQGAHPEIVHDETNIMRFNESKTGFDYRSDGKRHWFRVNVRSMDGALLLVGNPIYLNF